MTKIPVESRKHPFDPAALADAAAPLLGLAPSPESRAAVIVHLTIAAQQADLLLAADIGEDDEPAAVFRA
jgi:hypothetical protein